MDINDRLRGAFDEYDHAPEPKPTCYALSLKWRVHVQVIQGALAIQQLLTLTEAQPREPALDYRPRMGRPKGAVVPGQTELVEAYLKKAGGVYGACKLLGISYPTLRRYHTGKRGLPGDVLAAMRNLLDPITGVDKV